MNDFCRKKREGLRSSKAHLYRTFTWSPPGTQTRFFLIGEIMTFISRFIYELFAISLLAAATLWRTLKPSPLSQYICISSCAEISFTGVVLKVFNFSAVLPEFPVTSVLKNEIFVCVGVGICLLYSEGMNYLLFCHVSKHLSPVVQTMENAIHRIKIYPGENAIAFSKGGFPLLLNV